MLAGHLDGCVHRRQLTGMVKLAHHPPVLSMYVASCCMKLLLFFRDKPWARPAEMVDTLFEALSSLDNVSFHEDDLFIS